MVMFRTLTSVTLKSRSNEKFGDDPTISSGVTALNPISKMATWQRYLKSDQVETWSTCRQYLDTYSY
jgi:hypothetical protein